MHRIPGQVSHRACCRVRAPALRDPDQAACRKTDGCPDQLCRIARAVRLWTQEVTKSWRRREQAVAVPKVVWCGRDEPALGKLRWSGLQG